MAKQVNQKSEWQAPTTIWNSMFMSVFFSSIMMNLSQQMSNSNLSLYAKDLGSPADEIGSLMSMFAITAFIFRFVSGPAMNAFNRKKLLAMAMGFFAFSYFGFSFSPMIANAVGTDTVTVLKAFRLIQGIGNAFGNSCALTIVADFIPKDKFSLGMSYFSIAQAIAQAIGPTIGVWLSTTFNYHITYIIVGLFMLSAIAVSQIFIKNAPHERQKFNLNIKNMVAKEALVPAFAVFLIACGFTSINSFLLVYAKEQGIKGATLFFTVYAAALFVTKPILGKLTDKYGFVRVGTVAVLATAVSLLLIGFSKSLPMLLIAALINSCGYGAAQPALQSLCIKSVPPERRGSGSATNYIGMDGGTIVGPLLCGAVAARLGYTPAMWCVVSIPVFMSAAFIFLCRKRVNAIEDDFAARNAAN